MQLAHDVTVCHTVVYAATKPLPGAREYPKDFPAHPRITTHAAAARLRLTEAFNSSPHVEAIVMPGGQRRLCE